MSTTAIVLLAVFCLILGALIGWITGYAIGTESVISDLAERGLEIRREESHRTD